MSNSPQLIIEREAALLAPYAMRDADSLGRKHAEPGHPYRGSFQRDRDRIVHSTAFRRLADKTQVFAGAMGDYHRTRLTHTLEVASIARTIGRALKLNEDLIEALALLHDIGHPPFGHAGEEVLNERLADVGGFNHNSQAVRIAEVIEVRYPNFRGLNLTCEVLLGQASRTPVQKFSARLLETQVVDVADSIAYDAHDADDAVELGLIKLDDLGNAELWQTAEQVVRRRFSQVDEDGQRSAAVHAMIEMLTSDVIEATKRRLAEGEFGSAAEAAAAGELVAPSPDLAEQKAQLEKLLFEQVYRHPRILQDRQVMDAALRDLFDQIAADPTRLPSSYRELCDSDGPLRATADFVASQTDRSVREARRDAYWPDWASIGTTDSGC